jgi:hypothetical protein
MFAETLAETLAETVVKFFSLYDRGVWLSYDRMIVVYDCGMVVWS